MAEKLCDTHPVLLLVDDDAKIREQMKWALASDYQLLEGSGSFDGACACPARDAAIDPA